MGSLYGDRSLNSEAFQPLELNELRKQLNATIEYIYNYYTKVEDEPVLSRVQPGYIRGLLASAPPELSSSVDEALDDVRRAVDPGMTHWMSPNFFAYFPATLSSASLAGDLLASALNPVAFTWLSCPAATELEALVLDWLAQLLCLPDCFRSYDDVGGGRGCGVLHGSTSESMLCTIVAARDHILQKYNNININRLVAYGSDQTHSTFSKACKIAGFHRSNIRSIRTGPGSDYALDPVQLRIAMEIDIASGLVPAYVCATVGTTSSNAVDPVRQICDVADRFNVWVHVDAAYAGSACICPEFRHYLDGIDRADSLSLSPHKWMLTGLDCTCLWVKDRFKLIEPLGMDPEYLKNGPSESGSVQDLKDLQVGVGRRFRALKLWMVMRTYGSDKLRAHIRSDVAMARAFEEMVRKDEQFEVVTTRRFALVCFRLKSFDENVAVRLNRRLMELVNGTGRAYITHTVVGGKYVLRFAVGSTLTEDRHVEAAWQLIGETAGVVVSEELRI